MSYTWGDCTQLGAYLDDICSCHFKALTTGHLYISQDKEFSPTLSFYNKSIHLNGAFYTVIPYH